MAHAVTTSFALVSLLALSALTSAQDPASKGRSPAQNQLAAFYQGAPWQEFLAQDGGAWAVEWCAATGTPRAIWGSGIALADWRTNTIEEARRHAHQLMRDRADLLRLGDSEFREVIGSRMGRTWSFVFDQYFRGVPVIGGRVDVRVNMRGRVPMFGSTAWQLPDDFAVTPAIAEETALAVAWQSLALVPTGVPQPANVAAPRLVIWGDVHSAQPETPRLAWEIAISNVDRDGQGPIGRCYIDAQTTAMLGFQSDKHECGLADCPLRIRPAPDSVVLPVLTTVTVKGWTRTGLDGFSALVNAPLPGLELSVPGAGTVTTDQNGQFTINIASPVTITVGALNGRHHAAMSGGNAPGGSFTVNPGVATTIQLLTSGASAEEAAHTTVSWWTDKTNEFARSILGNSPQLATADNVVPTVNIANTCNAYYSGNTINFYATGGGCNNTAFSTIVAHEWGHGLDDRYGGISQVDGLSEAWGDTLAFYLADSPILGSGFSTAGVGIRNGNNATQYPASGGVHTQGQSFMGFAWKLRDHLATTLGNRPSAIAITNDIVLGSIVADATDQQAAVLEVFVADDDDGNLANHTPHWADLVWACDQHSLPYPGQTSPVPNDLCANAIPLANGVNGPFTTVGALTSSPSWACGSGAKDVWFTYQTQTAGTLTIQTCGLATWDTTIQILSGSCSALTSAACNDDTCSVQSSVSAAITPGTWYVRVGGYNGATGTFSLDVSGPGGVVAATAPFGTGCYHLSKAFYESFTAAGFDLANSGMRMIRNGNRYDVTSGGTFVAPTGAAVQLALTDDGEATVNLSGAFPFPGGTTTSLVVCANGFVSAAAGNGNDWSPTAAEWLASTQPRWGCWHDFNPDAAGSGKVKFEQIGSIAYLTWDNVYSYNTTAANRWQMQFDVATGNVTTVWSTMVASGSAWVVGFAATAPNDDLGSVNLSAALAGGLHTGADNTPPLTLTTSLPQLGQSMTLTTTNFTPASALGIQIISVTRYDPGIELSIANMPGCFLYSGTELLHVVIANAGTGVDVWTIPNDPTWMGLAVTTQTLAFAPGANTNGLITSNGVALTVGL
ncbi:MAG: hypothetical protein JNK78_19410 [Planctomycetes bacterium]|nr:hypothetical protein [Planctomycetota bacterium]